MTFITVIRLAVTVKRKYCYFWFSLSAKVEFLGNMYFSYCISSLFLTVSLMNWLLLQLKRKTSVHLKLYHYNTVGKLMICCCFCYNLYFIFYLKDFDLLDLLVVLVSSLIIIFLKQIHGYSISEINSCLDESRSLGAYWAHQSYDAYYKIVLEDIKDRMNIFEKENNINFHFKQLIIIIPLSCNAEGTLSDRDDAIKEFKFLNSVENDQGGNVNRTYKNCVYSIYEDTYIVAEFSSPVSTLWKSRFEMGEEKINYVRDSYIKTLKSLVKGSPGIIVEYDDVGKCPKSLSDCILSSIKENNYIV